MDIIENAKNMDRIISDKDKLSIEKKERENKALMHDLNKMHALMSEYLTPIAADYWLGNRVKQYRL